MVRVKADFSYFFEHRNTSSLCTNRRRVHKCPACVPNRKTSLTPGLGGRARLQRSWRSSERISNRSRTARIEAGSFSAVSKRHFASQYALESSRRDLHNTFLCTGLQFNCSSNRYLFLANSVVSWRLFKSNCLTTC